MIGSTVKVPSEPGASAVPTPSWPVEGQRAALLPEWRDHQRGEAVAVHVRSADAVEMMGRGRYSGWTVPRGCLDRPEATASVSMLAAQHRMSCAGSLEKSV